MKKILFILAAVLVLTVACGSNAETTEQNDSTKVVADTTIVITDTVQVAK